MIVNISINDFDILVLKICVKKRISKRFKLEFPKIIKNMNLEADWTLRDSTEECDDGTLTRKLGFSVNLKWKGPLRISGIPTAIGKNDLFGIITLEGHWKAIGKWCGANITEGYMQGEIQLWLGAKVKFLRISGSLEGGATLGSMQVFETGCPAKFRKGDWRLRQR